MSHLELLDYRTLKMGGGNQGPILTLTNKYYYTIGLSDNSIC